MSGHMLAFLVLGQSPERPFDSQCFVLCVAVKSHEPFELPQARKSMTVANAASAALAFKRSQATRIQNLKILRPRIANQTESNILSGIMQNIHHDLDATIYTYFLVPR